MGIETGNEDQNQLAETLNNLLQELKGIFSDLQESIYAMLRQMGISIGDETSGETGAQAGASGASPSTGNTGQELDEDGRTNEDEEEVEQPVRSPGTINTILPSQLNLGDRTPSQNRDLINILNSHSDLLTIAGNLDGNGGNSVALAMSKSLDLTKPVKLICHFHGLRSFDVNHRASDGRTRLDQTLSRLETSESNAILVYPLCEPPDNPDDYQYDRDWMKPPEYNFATLHQEVIELLAENGINLPPGSSVIAEGHSAGGTPLRNIAQAGHAGIIDRMVFLDATYGTWGRDTLDALEEFGHTPEVQVAFIDNNSDARNNSTAAGARELRNRQNVTLFRMNGGNGQAMINHGGAIDHFFGGVDDPTLPEYERRVVR
jgi:hypothetical protein